MNKFTSLLIGILTFVALFPISTAFATTYYQPWNQNTAYDSAVCSTLSASCQKIQAINTRLQDVLVRYGRSRSFAEPEACTMWQRECQVRVNSYYEQRNCTGYCPDGTTYNACSSTTGSDPCRTARGTTRDTCAPGTVPERVCANSYPQQCYTTCVSAPSECRGVCANGRTYNLCTTGPTYECLGW